MLFASYGISSTHAVSFGFAEFIMLLVIGSFGGLRFVLRKSSPKEVCSVNDDIQKL
jgi:hypothetical protein